MKQSGEIRVKSYLGRYKIFERSLMYIINEGASVDLRYSILINVLEY